MTIEEKIINHAREALIEIHGEEFLELDEGSQNELIYAKIMERLNREKGGNNE